MLWAFGQALKSQHAIKAQTVNKQERHERKENDYRISSFFSLHFLYITTSSKNRWAPGKLKEKLSIKRNLIISVIVLNEQCILKKEFHSIVLMLTNLLCNKTVISTAARFTKACMPKWHGPTLCTLCPTIMSTCSLSYFAFWFKETRIIWQKVTHWLKKSNCRWTFIACCTYWFYHCFDWLIFRPVLNVTGKQINILYVEIFFFGRYDQIFGPSGMQA